MNLLKNINKYILKEELKIKLNPLSKYIFQKNNIDSKKMLREDLLIRLAKRTNELENLSYGLSNTKNVSKVIRWYTKSFEELANFNIINDIDPILENIFKRHTPTLITMANGMKELKLELDKRYNQNIDISELNKLNNQLHNFYINRLSLRVIIDQYLQSDNTLENYNGIICENMNPLDPLNIAIKNASEVCYREYNISPNINIEYNNEIFLTYIPSYLYYVYFEILKNSMRATIENNNNVPDINIMITGKENIVIQISDKGKGIPSEIKDKVWYYSFSTMKNNHFNSKDDFSNDLPMAGYGYGLPISKAIMNFLEGDLYLMSMEDYGTNTYIHL